MKKKTGIKLEDAINCLILMGLFAFFYLPTMTPAVLGDSLTYMKVAQDLLETRQLHGMSHFLYPVLVLIVKVMLATTYWRAAKLVHLLLYMLIGLVLYFAINGDNGEKPSLGSPVLKILVPFSLVMAAPVLVLAPFDHHLYFGYISITVYHSATMATLRPLALLQFFIVLQFLQFKKPASVYLIASAGILTVLAALAKPSLTIALIPAYGILLVVLFFMKKKVDWKASILGIFIPAILVLAWQFIFTYIDKGNTAGNSSIIFAPLLVYKLWKTGWLLPKFFLSILFPLGVLIVYFPTARKDMRLWLAWLTFLIGAAYGYLLAETVGADSGNFTWSGQIGLFILFVFSMKFVLEQYRMDSALPSEEMKISPKVKISIALGLYGLHVIAGIFWYLCHLDVFGLFSKIW